MSSHEIPEPIRRFLYETIHSFEEFEVVVLLAREGARRTEGAIADALKMSLNSVGDALKALGNRGIVRPLTENATTYWLPSRDYEAELQELVALHEQHRLEIVMLMSTNAIERVRTGAMRTFADCFFVGRGKRDDG